jgi:hypothetical protein
MITFAGIGLVFASQAISGGISRWSIDFRFVTAGALVLVATAWTARHPGLVGLSQSLTESGPAADSGQAT